MYEKSNVPIDGLVRYQLTGISAPIISDVDLAFVYVA